MKREKGVIVEVADDKVIVAMDGRSHTECRSCGICRSASQGKAMLVDIPDRAGRNVGDRVVVEVPGPSVGASAAILLFMPLVLFLAGLGLGTWLYPGRDGPIFVAGLCVMGIGFGFAALYDRRLRHSPKYQPRIVESGE